MVWQPTPGAWRILWTEEPGGLQSVGLQRVRHDCATEHAHGTYAFLQYAAWCMRNFILNDIKAYSSVVRNEPNSQHYSDCEEFSDKLAYEDEHYTDDYDRIVRIIREKIEAKYNIEKCEMLYHSMALFGYKKMTLKELSIQYGISQPGIKQMNDRIINYIRSDEELFQAVTDLCTE